MWVAAASFAAGSIAGCTGPATSSSATQAALSPAAFTLPGAASEFPVEASTGVPAGTRLKPWTGPLRTSEAEGLPTEAGDGVVCQLFEGLEVELADTGDYLYVDSPCVILRNCRFSTTGEVSNTGAMVQQAEENNLLVVENSEFDGGPRHQRGLQADYSTAVVTGSRFTRFGNAGVEMNNRDVDADLTVEDSFFLETGGWDREDHVDGIQVGGARDVTIRDNTVLVQAFGAEDGDESYVSNSALGLWAEAGDVAGSVIIDHNLLGGGGQVIYLESKNGFTFRGAVTVVANVFDRRYSRLGGIWGVLAQNNVPRSLSWNDNTWDDGTPLSFDAVTHPGDLLSPETTSGQ
jgi:hypothetical protein